MGVGTYGQQLKAALRDQIKEEMHDRGITAQAELARRAGVSTSAVSRWLDETKDRGMTVEDMADVAAALGLSSKELLDRAERRIVR